MKTIALALLIGVAAAALALLPAFSIAFARNN
jgi:hypothetical protein